MPISLEAARQALAFALATPRTGSLRHRNTRSDFGGRDSFLLKVRRIGRDYPFGDDIQDGDFGLYLGRHEGAYTVALQSILGAEIIGLEQFPSVPELKRHWELD
jgi:hypothetical protein